MRAVKHPEQQRWHLDHDPDARPLGCNGKYGQSGLQRHYRRGEKVCDDCRVSNNHYAREKHRGQLLPRRLKPCGTAAAARRHRKRGEPVCYACRVGESNERTAYYQKTSGKLAA